MSTLEHERDEVSVDLSDSPAPRTTVVVRDPDEAPAPKRRIARLRTSDLLQVVGAAAGAIAFTGVLFAFIAPFDGPVGFVLVAYAVFLLLYGLVVWQDEDGPAVVDRLVAAVVTSLAITLGAALVYVVGYVLTKGLEALRLSNFYTEDMADAGPLDPLTSGGILHAMVGSLIMIAMALVVVVPLGITTAVFLNEMPGRFSRFVRIIVEAMTALPSIIAGLFIYATLIIGLGIPKSGLAASLAISVMMLPIIIRAADVVIRLVPGNLKEASYALGASQVRTVWHVVLPTARSGLMTAVILGTARGVGETSPVLLTAGFTQSLNTNPFEGPMISLPLAAFKFIGSSEESFKLRGFGAAAVLLALVLILFIVARIIGGRGPGQLSERQRKKAARQSRRDYARMVPDDPSPKAAPAPVTAAISSPAGPREGDTPS
ncbi:MAG: phosphate ABC transporter permease PstA [Acidimicrobiia bacterium]